MKQRLRQKARTLGSELSDEWIRSASASIRVQLEHLLEDIDYRTIGIYMPMRDEPQLGDLYEFMEAEGRELFLPRVLDAEHIAYYRYKSGDSLEENGCFALKEPLLTSLESDEALDVLLVPAIHFYNNYRLGRGKGYYDRYIAKHRPKHLIGLTLGVLGDEAFEAEAWDIPMDIVLRPKY